VAWAIRYEMARTIDDVLARRVRLLFLDAVQPLLLVKVARLLAKELDHDEAWTQNQIAEFKTIANGFLLSDFQQ
jgi:glycerol-3-phosphate dehydrogenase